MLFDLKGYQIRIKSCENVKIATLNFSKFHRYLKSQNCWYQELLKEISYLIMSSEF